MRPSRPTLLPERPSPPPPRSNSTPVSNSWKSSRRISEGWGLLQFGQRFLDRLEVGQFLRSRGLFAVLHHPMLVDDEGGPGTDRAQAEQVRQECAVGFGGFLVEVAGQAEADFFLLRPGLLGEWAVDT